MINKSVIVIFLILLFCSLSHASELMSNEAYNHFNEGVKAQKARNFRNAQTNYQRALLIDKECDCKKFILNNSAVMYVETGDVNKAEWAFKEALSIDPSYNIAAFNLSLLYLRLAQAYREQGDMERAIEHYEKASLLYEGKDYVLEAEKEIKEEEF